MIFVISAVTTTQCSMKKLEKLSLKKNHANHTGLMFSPSPLKLCTPTSLPPNRSRGCAVPGIEKSLFLPSQPSGSPGLPLPGSPRPVQACQGSQQIILHYTGVADLLDSPPSSQPNPTYIWCYLTRSLITQSLSGTDCVKAAGVIWKKFPLGRI